MTLLLLVLKSESDVYTQKIEIELIATNLKDIVAECLGGCIVVVVRLEGHYRRAH